MDVREEQIQYLEIIDCQLFAVYTVEKWIGIICEFKESENLTFLTCVYTKMWEVDAMTLALSAPEWFVLPVA